VDALHLRGSQYYEAKDYARAVADYQAVLQLEPADTNVRLTLVDLLATCPDEKVRNLARADEAAEQLSPNSAGSHRAFATLAAAHAQRGELDQAIAWQRKALACAAHLDKEEKRRVTLVLELYRTRKKQAAKASARRATRSTPPPQDDRP
jgi:tetratricopeptide (TPR) repeat protein